MPVQSIDGALKPNLHTSKHIQSNDFRTKNTRKCVLFSLHILLSLYQMQFFCSRLFIVIQVNEDIRFVFKCVSKQDILNRFWFVVNF